MATPDLKANGLYVLLFIRAHPPVPDDFHWALYIHRDSKTGGTKYHIRQPGSSAWLADHGPVAAVMKSFLLVGLFQIADIPAGLEEHVDRTMKSFDARLNDIPTTCRVWMFWVLELLQRPENRQTVLRCESLERLEREIKDWGNSNAMSAAGNEQPRPVAASLLCGL